MVGAHAGVKSIPATTATATARSKTTQHFTDVACFFLLSVGYKIPWTAISSLLGQLGRDFGPNSLLYLNIAYFFPSIPVLLLQSRYQEQLERRYGVAESTFLRLGCAFGGLSYLAYNFPTYLSSLRSTVTATTLVGICYGLAFGASYQLVSRFSDACSVALTTGAHLAIVG